MNPTIVALIYIIPTFALAYIWHLKIFPEKYTKWNYFGEPSPKFGLLSIIVQAIIIAALLSYVEFNLFGQITTYSDFVAWALHTIQIMSLMGLFHWSIHVLAAMAKHKELRNTGFFSLESFYLILQFGIFTLLLVLVSFWHFRNLVL